MFVQQGGGVLGDIEGYVCIGFRVICIGDYFSGQGSQIFFFFFFFFFFLSGHFVVVGEVLDVISGAW